MCVVSMVMDHYHDKWRDLRPVSPIPYVSPGPPNYPTPLTPMLTEEEIKEFRKWLERAKLYDIEHSEPECEMEEKKEKLRKLAEELGVFIDLDDIPPKKESTFN